jgi:hypothetical protein
VLEIQSNDLLEDLTGLDMLASVGGELFLHQNLALDSLQALTALTAVDSLRVQVNPSLTTLDGLEGITGALPGNLVLSGADALVDATALSGITTVGGTLELRDLSFSTVEFLSGITACGGLEVGENDNLEHLDGLSALATIDGDVEIAGNLAMTRLGTLGGPTSIGGFVNIRLNFFLAQLDGLTNVETIGGELYLSNNATVNVDPLSSLTTLGGNLRIEGNADLNDLGGLDALCSVGGDTVSIASNPQLPATEANDLASRLQTMCGFMGTVNLSDNNG